MKGTGSTALLQYIPYGRENAISMAQLSKRLGVCDRTVRRLVLNARSAGYNIISGRNGYYFTDTADQDTKRFCKEREKAAVTTLKSIKTAQEKLKGSGYERTAEILVKT